MSMLVEGEEDESIFTKDERSVRYERFSAISVFTQSVISRRFDSARNHQCELGIKL